MDATNFKAEYGARKMAILIQTVGDEALELYNTFDWAAAETPIHVVGKHTGKQHHTKARGPNGGKSSGMWKLWI